MSKSMCEACRTGASGRVLDVVAVEADVEVARAAPQRRAAPRAARAGAWRGRRRGGGCRPGPGRDREGCARGSRARCASAPDRLPPRGGRPSRCAAIVSFLASRDRVKGAGGMYQGDATGSAVLARRRAPACWRVRAPGARTSARAWPPPRSGNGTSIVSKSRGASVAANTARACVAQLAAGVAARDVGQRQQPHLGVARELRGLARGAVLRLARALGLLLGEGRLVDEHVGLVRGERERLARRGVAGDHDLAPLPASRPITCSGLTPATVSPRCRRPKSGPGRHTEPLGERRVEVSRARRPPRARSRRRLWALWRTGIAAIR